MEKLRAVIYIRVSDPSQIENNSLETQLKACKVYAEAHAYEIVAVFREEGVSAKHIQTRPEMRRLFEFCTLKKNNISAVFVYKMDRWSRNVEEGLFAQSFLANHKVTVLPVAETTEQSPMANAMRTFLMTFGQLENELKGERVRDNMKTMFRKGLWCWKCRPGYKRKYKTKEENKGIPPAIDDSMAKYIKMLFDKASETTVGKQYLADYLNKAGFEGVYGIPADGRLVSRILQDTFYYGYMFAPKWKEYAWGKHEPITDQITWEKANVNVFGRKMKYKHQDNNLYPLKGFLLCSGCLGNMTSSNPRGRSKVYLYYECHDNKCTSPQRIRVDTTHDQFFEILGKIRPSNRVLKLFSYLVFSEWDKSVASAKVKAGLLDQEIKKLEDKLTFIAESNSKSILTDDEATMGAEKIRQDMTLLRLERSDIRIEQYNTEVVKKFIESFLLNMDKLWLRMELPQKQALQEEIFPNKIVAENGNIRTDELASTFKLINALGGEENDLVSHTGLEPFSPITSVFPSVSSSG